MDPHIPNDKECDTCGRAFFRRARDSHAQWASKRFCSTLCWQRHGPFLPVHLRFWQYVKREGECLLWTGAADDRGYGNIGYGERTIYKAHRVSWEMRYGPIPERALFAWSCDNRLCVEPNHLSLTTKSEIQKAVVQHPNSRANLIHGAPGARGARKAA